MTSAKDELLARIVEEEQRLAKLNREQDEARARVATLRRELDECYTDRADRSETPVGSKGTLPTSAEEKVPTVERVVEYDQEALLLSDETD